MVNLELNDIQALILTGHGHLPQIAFYLLEISDRANAKRWLGDISDKISTARRRPKEEAKPDTALQIAFTSTGLRAIGLPEEVLQTFQWEFTNGMAAPARARILGDTGGSSPEKWEWGKPGGQPVHVLLIVYAKDIPTLEAACKEQEQAFAVGGMRQVAREQAHPRTDMKEPFGFRDSIAQPNLEGGHRTASEENPARAGEFILGYLNEYNIIPFSPTVKSEADLRGVLPISAAHPGQKDLGRNGTYVVVRTLRQDVEGFWKYCEDQTRRPDGSPDADRKVWLASKMVGRWPSGTSLVQSPDKDDPKFSSDPRRINRFLYMPTDPDGFKCPIGSHVRRSNPRDSLPPDAQESLNASSHHRLIRRGAPYLKQNGAGKPEHGLIFVALNADLRRQFEFVQQSWINDEHFNGLYNTEDPIAGDSDGTSTFMMPGPGVRQTFTGYQRFVHTRAGAYFFMPGIKALKYLAG